VSFDLVAEDLARFRALCAARGTDAAQEIRAMIAAQLAHPGCRLSQMLVVRLKPADYEAVRQAARRRRVSVARLVNEAFRAVASLHHSGAYWKSGIDSAERNRTGGSGAED
jgi:predicted HicB family RNase H-like nuclease